MAAAGAVVGALIALGGWIARRTGAPSRTAAALAALGVAPLVVYDALALFTGHRAASVPAHGALSAAIALGALFAVGWGARVYGGRLAPRRRRELRAGWTAAAALFAVGAGCHLANRLVLPRLYHWFHLSLGAATLVAFVLAVRLRSRGGRAAGVALLAAATALACFVSVVGLGRSQGLRYVAYERTTLTALALRALPASGEARTAAASGRQVGRTRASAAARRPAPPAGGRPAHHHRRAPIRSRRRLRLRPQHDPPPRPAGRRGDALFTRLFPGAAHLLLRVVDADVEVLPDHGPPRAGRTARHDRFGAAQLRLEDGGVLSAGRLLHRLEQAENLRRDELRLRVRQVRVHRRPAPRRSAARLLRHGQAQPVVRLGPLLRAPRALRRARRVSVRRRATSTATTARSPTPTPPSGDW